MNGNTMIAHYHIVFILNTAVFKHRPVRVLGECGTQRLRVVLLYVCAKRDIRPEKLQKLSRHGDSSTRSPSRWPGRARCCSRQRAAGPSSPSRPSPAADVNRLATAWRCWFCVAAAATRVRNGEPAPESSAHTLLCPNPLIATHSCTDIL